MTSQRKRDSLLANMPLPAPTPVVPEGERACSFPLFECGPEKQVELPPPPALTEADKPNEKEEPTPDEIARQQQASLLANAQAGPAVKKKLVRVRRLKPGAKSDDPNAAASKPADGENGAGGDGDGDDAKKNGDKKDGSKDGDKPKENSPKAGDDAHDGSGVGPDGSPLQTDGKDEMSKLINTGAFSHWRDMIKPVSSITLGQPFMADADKNITDFLRTVTGGNRAFSVKWKPDTGALKCTKGIEEIRRLVCCLSFVVKVLDIESYLRDHRIDKAVPTAGGHRRVVTNAIGHVMASVAGQDDAFTGRGDQKDIEMVPLKGKNHSLAITIHGGEETSGGAGGEVDVKDAPRTAARLFREKQQKLMTKKAAAHFVSYAKAHPPVARTTAQAAASGGVAGVKSSRADIAAIDPKEKAALLNGSVEPVYHQIYHTEIAKAAYKTWVAENANKEEKSLLPTQHLEERGLLNFEDQEMIDFVHNSNATLLNIEPRYFEWVFQSLIPPPPGAVSARATVANGSPNGSDSGTPQVTPVVPNAVFQPRRFERSTNRTVAAIKALTVSANEHRRYRDLLQFLLYACEDKSDDPASLFQNTFRQLHATIKHLREVEMPFAQHSVSGGTGFLHAIDNLVAVLMYREIEVDKDQHAVPPRKTEVRTIGLSESAKAIAEAKRRQSSANNPVTAGNCKGRCCGVLFAVLLAAVVVLGFYALYSIWYYSTHDEVQSAINVVSQQILSRVNFDLQASLNAPSIIAQLVKSTYDVGDLGTLDLGNPAQQDNIDRFFIHMMKVSLPSITGIYLGTQNGGGFIGAFRQTNASVVLLYAADSTTGGCLNSYIPDATGKRSTFVANISCPYDSRLNGWYYNNIRDRGWSSVYPFDRTLPNPQLGFSYNIVLRVPGTSESAPGSCTGAAGCFPAATPADQPFLNKIPNDQFYHFQNVVGVLGVDVGLGSLSTGLQAVRLPLGGVAFVVTPSDGVLIASSSGEYFTYNSSYPDGTPVPASETNRPLAKLEATAASTQLITATASYVVNTLGGWGALRPTTTGAVGPAGAGFAGPLITKDIVGGATVSFSNLTLFEAFPAVCVTAFPTENYLRNLVESEYVNLAGGMLGTIMALMNAYFIYRLLPETPTAASAPGAHWSGGGAASGAQSPGHKKGTPSKGGSGHARTSSTGSLEAVAAGSGGSTIAGGASGAAGAKELGKNRRKLVGRLVTGTAVLVVVCVMLVWIFWVVSSTSAINTIATSLMTETMDRSKSFLLQHVNLMALINTFNVLRYERNPALFDAPPVNLMAPDPNAVEFYAHRDRQFAEIITSIGSYASVINAAYFADTSGQIAGVGSFDVKTIKQATSTGFESLFIGTLGILARDPMNSMVYHRYGLLPEPPNGLTFVRNTSNVLAVDPFYEPRMQPFYTKAVQARKPTFLPPYLRTSDGLVGFTMVIPYANASGVFKGVFGVDQQRDFNEYLASIDLNSARVQTSALGGTVQNTKLNTAQARLFLLNKADMLLLASSTNEHSRLYNGQLNLLTATDANDTIIAEASKYIAQMPGGPASINEFTKLERAADKPLTFVTPIVYPTVPGIEWLLVVTVASDDLYGGAEVHQTFTFIVCAGIIAMILYFAKVGYKSLSEIVRLQTDDEHAKTVKALTGSLDRTRLLETMGTISDGVFRANTHSWRRATAGLGDVRELPVDYQLIKQHATERAAAHISDAKKSRNILTMCQLECYESKIPLQLYKLTTYWVYRFTIQAVILVHIMIAFVGPFDNQSLKNQDVNRALAYVEGFCLVVEYVYVILKFLVNYHWHDSTMVVGGAKDLTVPPTLWHDVVLLVTVVACSADFVLKVGYKYSFQFYLPIRVLLIVLANGKVNRACRAFLNTLFTARHVFVLYFCLVLVASCIGIPLFRSILNPSSYAGSFSTFIRAMTTAFVYIVTSENFTDVVYPAYAANPAYVIFFVVFTVLCQFFILAVIIHIFNQGFSKENKRQQQDQIFKQRTGLLAAFLLLDMDDDAALTLDEFTDFIRSQRPNLDASKIVDLYFAIDTRHSTAPAPTVAAVPTPVSPASKPGHKRGPSKGGAGGSMALSPMVVAAMTPNERLVPAASILEIDEFVRGYEEVSSYLIGVSQDSKAITEGRLSVLRNEVFERPYWDRVVLCVVVTHIWFVALYGSYADEAKLDSGLLGCLIFYLCELVLKVLTYGPTEYWFYSSFALNRGKQQKEFAHRFDCVAVVVCVILAFGMYYGVGHGSSDDLFRFALAIPTIRILILTRKTRQLFLIMSKIFPSFISLFALLLLVFYVYAVYGIFFFRGLATRVMQDAAPVASFETLGSAFVALFQMLTGAHWDEIMYPHILASDWITTWYFVSFIFIVTLLFTNLFVGVILSVFSQLADKDEISDRDIQRALYEGEAQAASAAASRPKTN